MRIILLGLRALAVKFHCRGKSIFRPTFSTRDPPRTPRTGGKGILSTNMAFSKDVVEDKATLSLNVSDLFNTRKRRSETRTDNVFTYSEFQFRQRQITMSFLYRFNQPQNQRNRNGRRGGGDGDGDLDFEG